MREYLAPLAFRRHRFTAVIGDRGTERRWGDPGGPPTLLLRELACAETDQPLAEHVWSPMPPEIASRYPFPEGARISFRARVRPYRRGDGTDDYQLTQIREIVWEGEGGVSHNGRAEPTG